MEDVEKHIAKTYPKEMRDKLEIVYLPMKQVYAIFIKK